MQLIFFSEVCPFEIMLKNSRSFLKCRLAMLGLGWLNAASSAHHSSVHWPVFWYLGRCSMFCVQTLTHRHPHTPCLLWLHIFSLCGMMCTLVHAHTLNLCRSKREDKLLNPAASKLTTCAGTTKAGVTVLQKSAGH